MANDRTRRALFGRTSAAVGLMLAAGLSIPAFGLAAEQRSADDVAVAEETRAAAVEAAAEAMATIEAMLASAADDEGASLPNGGSLTADRVAYSDGSHGGDETGDHGEGGADKTADAEEVDPLEEMRKEQQRLQTEYSLMMQRQKNEMLEMELEKQRIQAESQMRSTLQSEELAAMRAEIERLQVEAQLERATTDAQLAELRKTIEILQAEKQLKSVKADRELDDLRRETERLQAQASLENARLQELRRESSRLQAMAESEVAELEAQMRVQDTKARASQKVLKDINYVMDPHQGDTLYVSDRRIALNGPIITGTADYIVERIDYFNNRSSEKPIFIVIDSCPGGSVMEGYKIVQAIERSDAPVHVVVTQYAASMAAVITTLADHSYAYPNAIILHHQMSSGMRGNLTQQAEQLENAFEWARRLAEPVADKMGVSYERFVELMYENNSDGDWEEFADRAKELKWVDNVIQEIREQGVREQPTSSAPSFFFWFMQEPDQAMPEMKQMRRDTEGRPFIQLPPLRPFDHYFMHNPEQYYRW